MAKIDQEIKEIKNAITALDDKIGKLQFFLIQIMNKIEGGEQPIASPTTSASAGPVSVDIAPLEERLEILAKSIASKEDINSLTSELAKLRDEKMQEAEDAIDNVTVLLEKGLAITELTSTLKEIEAHLQELVSPPEK